MNKPAEITQEYGPFPGIDAVHGVTYDGRHVWLASGDKLNALDPHTGQVTRHIDAAASAGTAFDGKCFYQVAGEHIQKIDPHTGEVLASIRTPDGDGHSGLAWAEGMLWVAHYKSRKIYQVDPDTGKVLNTLQSDRYVTGVTWVDGELWHGTWEDDASQLRQIDPHTGQVLDSLDMPPGAFVSGLESDGESQFFCGGGATGKLRSVRRPKRVPQQASPAP
ncbi:glutaminyl-peptide cyclotransferase [Bordetella petrii]|uniref:Vgb family protein n=1 Tax=Bordetella petrii TaxID=94624 RepID=UPI001E3A172D|nr:glutaminyl-peptide cyclotransferase [Bordetella petrii]MCD0505353.1 PQQ-binding-like beta-propeller repeat protein [Bordetella petrii]